MNFLDDNNKPINPFIRVGKSEKIKPFYKLEDETNSPDRFAILKTTENGKYVRGGMLWFKFAGVEIFTEIDNVIFVDKINKIMTVKDYSKTLDEINPVDPEQRQYVILMYHYDDIESDGQAPYTWASMEGRSTIYRYIKDYIDTEYIDPDKSIILTENVTLKDALTVTQFVNYLKNGNLVPEDDFDINDYRSGGDDNV